MIRRPPGSTRTYTRCPSTTLCPSALPDAARIGLEMTARQHHAFTLGQLRHREAQVVQRDMAALAQQQEQRRADQLRSEEHTSELQSLMRISYTVFCLKKTILDKDNTIQNQHKSTDMKKTYTA